MGGGTSAPPSSARRSFFTRAVTAEVQRKESPPPRKVFFCHSCSSFCYESQPGGQHNSVPSICPQPFCRPRTRARFEEIPSSVEGSLRLQVIMLELINSRAVMRTRTSKPVIAGVCTADIILETNLVKLTDEEFPEAPFCSVCNDSFYPCSSSGSACASPHTHTALKLQCGHIFHHSCILPWLAAHRSCPCCRTNVKHWSNTPTPEELCEKFDESQMTIKIEYALTTKAYLIAKEVESAMMSDRKEDSSLNKIRYTLERPSCCDIVGIERKVELANRLHGLLMRVSAA